MKKILFVCTGNTCRSPMAEMIFKDILRKRKITSIEVSSAGIYACEGEEMNKCAQAALKIGKCHCTEFESTLLTAEMIASSDLVVVMTAGHKRALSSFANVQTLDELVGCGEVEDPFGSPSELYEKCFKQLKLALEKLAEKVV